MSNHKRIFNINVGDINKEEAERFIEDFKRALKTPLNPFQPLSDVLEYHEERYRANIETMSYWAAEHNMMIVIQTRVKLIKEKYCA